MHLATQYKIELKELEMGRRWFPDVEARYICFWLIDSLVLDFIATPERYALIGHFFNNANKNTVRYGLKRIEEDWIKVDKQFSSRFKEIKHFVELNILDNEKLDS